jgi:hypothetical protein
VVGIRARRTGCPTSHHELVEEAQVALVMAASVLRGLPHPHDGLTDYLESLRAL